MQLFPLWDWWYHLILMSLVHQIFLKILWFHFLKLNTFCFIYVPDFTICSSIYGQLDWFQYPLIVKRVYRSKHEVQISLWQAQNSLGASPGMKYCGHMVVLFLIFWGTSKTDSRHGHCNLQTPATENPVYQHPLQHLLLDFLIAVMTEWVPPHSKIMFTEIRNHRFVLECWSHSIYSDHP